MVDQKAQERRNSRFGIGNLRSQSEQPHFLPMYNGDNKSNPTHLRVGRTTEDKEGHNCKHHLIVITSCPQIVSNHHGTCLGMFGTHCVLRGVQPGGRERHRHVV